MNVFIMTDLEGISGVDTIDMVLDTESAGHQTALQRLMLDVNAAIAGAIDGGAKKVYIFDGHGRGVNFIKQQLDPRAEQIANMRALTPRMREIDAFMIVGQHAMAGTINGFLDHTQSSATWYNYYINGRKCGELAQVAAFGGIYNIPVVMVSGDEAACVEAKQFFGDVACAVVKYGRGRNQARFVEAEEALKLIHDAALDGMGLAGKIKPFKPLLPVELKLEFCRADFCEEYLGKCPDAERLDARTIRRVVTAPKEHADFLFG